MSEDMQPLDVQEARQERTESVEQVRSLDQATFEPESVVENSASYHQAEAVESTFQQVVVQALGEESEVSTTAVGNQAGSDQQGSSASDDGERGEAAASDSNPEPQETTVHPDVQEARQDQDGSNAWESMADGETDLRSLGELLEPEEQSTATDTTGVQEEQMQAVETQFGSPGSTSMEGAEQRSSYPAERGGDPEGVLPGDAPSSAAGSSTAGVESPAAAHAVGGRDVPGQGGLELERAGEDHGNGFEGAPDEDPARAMQVTTPPAAVGRCLRRFPWHLKPWTNPGRAWRTRICSTCCSTSSSCCRCCMQFPLRCMM